MRINFSRLLKGISGSDKYPTDGRKYTTDEVAGFYEEYTDTYLQTTGDFIQAYRTADTDDLMKYLVGSMGLRDGMCLLDAGCGVGAPAIWIARQFPNVLITSVTNSEKQYSIATQTIESAGLENRITVVKGDYHRLPAYCRENAFDLAIFLESLGHNHDLDAVFRGVSHVLKPGGGLYVKDFFKRHSRDLATRQSIDEVVEVINRNYLYNVMDLPEFIETLLVNNFSLNYVQSPKTPSDLGIAVAFENKSGRLTYPSFSKIRALAWFEISATRD